MEIVENQNKYNVFIFNFIKHNEKDVDLLRKTFQRFRCKVQVYSHLKEKQFYQAAKYIATSNFKSFNYIVIAVLDNRNKSGEHLRTSDKCDVHLQRSLLSYIQRNKTLLAKQRLFIVQTNQILATDDSCEKYNSCRHFRYSGPTVKLYASYNDAPLENHWSPMKAAVSPFIKSFCKHFDIYAEFTEIGEICDDVVDELREQRDQPFKEGNTDGMVRIFGMATTAENYIQLSKTERPSYGCNRFNCSIL